MERRKYFKEAGVAVTAAGLYGVARRTCLLTDNSLFKGNIDIYEVGDYSYEVSPGHAVANLARRSISVMDEEVMNETQFDINVKSL